MLLISRCIVVLTVLILLLLPCLTAFSIQNGRHSIFAYSEYIGKRTLVLMSKADEESSNKSTTTTTTTVENEPKTAGFFDFLSPYESKIPKSLEAEIFNAEARTPAAQDRNVRVAIFTTIAVVGILGAFFNGFLTELRNTPDVDGNILTLDEVGFSWVVGNPISSFLFTNAIGGGLCLLLGGGCGLLAEAELDTRRLNAERIYEELVRRRTEREEKKQQKAVPAIKKKRRNKTLEALAEVLAENIDTVKSTLVNEVKQPRDSTLTKEEPKSGNLLDQVKEMYKKADAMAASQALLLNKKLEDQGILERITDESGLKVIGKVAASAKILEKDSSSSSEDSSLKR